MTGCVSTPTPDPNNPLLKTPGMDDPAPQALVFRNLSEVFVKASAPSRGTDEESISYRNDWLDFAHAHHVQSMKNPADARVFNDFAAQFDEFKGFSLKRKAYAVNDRVNKAVFYTRDTKLYGREEYYACPVETIKKEKGDCEDFAILKYYVLKNMGVPDNRLFLTTVNDGNRNNGDREDRSNHAVLLMNVADEGMPAHWMMLENGSIISGLSDNSGYRLFGLFNESGHWLPDPAYFAPPPRT